MSKGPGPRIAIALMLIGVGGVGALAWYVKSDPLAAKVPASLTKPSNAPDVTILRPKKLQDGADESNPSQIGQTVLTPVLKDDKLASEMTPVAVPDGMDPKVFLVQQISKSLHVDARVLGVDVHNRTAVINFGDGIDDGMGSDQESLFLASLQRGFGQFPEIDNLELNKESQPLETVGGHIDLTDGLPVTRSAPAEPSAPKPSSP